MVTWKAFCETVHVVALALWLGFVVAAGTFAATVFGVTKDLDPRLPGYESYTGEHYLIVGGKMAQTVFFVTDIVQFACTLVAAATLIATFGFRREESRRPAMLIRMSSVVVGMAAVAALLLIVNPKITSATRAYWEAAKAGDTALALSHKAIAGDTHPYASALMVTAAASVLLALIAAVWSLARPGALASAVVKTSLPEPALLRGRP